MARRPLHRDAIVRSSVSLFRRNGYSATGLSDIIELSGAPKGSLYHYFPEGKLSIAEAAVRQAGETVTKTLEKQAVEDPLAPALVRSYCELLAKWMEQSGFRAGCPIATALLETAPGNRAITRAGRDAFAAWRSTIATRLMNQNVETERAARLAILVISAIEGSLILSRVERSGAPIRSCGIELELLLLSAVGQSRT